MSVGGVGGGSSSFEMFRMLVQQTSSTTAVSAPEHECAPPVGAGNGESAAAGSTGGSSDGSSEMIAALRSQIEATLEKFLKKWLQDKPEEKTDSATSADSTSETESDADAAAAAEAEAAAATEGAEGSDEDSEEESEGANKGVDLLSRFKWALSEILENNTLKPTAGQGRPPGPPPDGPPPGDRPQRVGNTVSDLGASTSSLNAALESHGIDAEEFRKNLLTTLQGISANGSQINYSKVFQGFPRGTSVDFLA